MNKLKKFLVFTLIGFSSVALVCCSNNHKPTDDDPSQHEDDDPSQHEDDDPSQHEEEPKKEPVYVTINDDSDIFLGVPVEEEDQKNDIINFDFVYTLIRDPGAPILEYENLWRVEEYDNYQPYILDFKEEISYYGVYLDITELNNCEEFFDDYERRLGGFPGLEVFHFFKGTKSKIIDGKYLFAAQRLGIDKLKVFKFNSIQDISQHYNDDILVFVAESKNVNIVKNISLGADIEKDVNLYNRIPVHFGDDTVEDLDSLLNASSSEKSGVYRCNEIFDYVGKYVELFQEEYESVSCIYSPMLGFSRDMFNLHIQITDNYILLPRYFKIGNEIADYLDESTEFPWYVEDIYGNLKSLFLDAFIGCEVEGLPKQDLKGYYDFDKVCEIIKKVEDRTYAC